MNLESEEKYKTILESIEDSYYEVDLTGNFTFFNKAACKLSGCSKEELRTMNYQQFVDKATARKVYAMFNKVYETGEPSKAFDWQMIRRDGAKRHVEASASLIRKASGKPLGFRGIIRDITERKLMENALKKSEQRYRSVFENAGLPLVIMEKSLFIFMVNDKFAEMSGYKKEEIQNRMRFTDFIASGDREQLKKCFSHYKGRSPIEYECRIAHRNGEQFDVLIRLGKIPRADQLIASFMDITSRKQAELALLETQEHLQKENIRLRSSIKERYRFCDIIGKSHVMQEVYEFILQAAATQANVIIYGESGTGKELVAKAIHETSDRSKKSFVTVHCGAIPETLMESEFFGYKKGAFTGANIDKCGYLDGADGGTLFLDEVGDIGLSMQVKLLRSISGDGYTPVGSNRTKKTDVRIIAATNRNLRDLVNRGLMREDFFYRIHILPIYIPPLRERKDDLLLLIEHFLQLYDKNHPPLPGHIAEALLNYNWYGNVRELQNVLHRYMTLKRLDFAGTPLAKLAPVETKSSKITGSSIEFTAENAANNNEAKQEPYDSDIQKEDLPLAMETFERDHIMKVLSENKWHRRRSASALGINRKTLFRKMQKFGLI